MANIKNSVEDFLKPTINNLGYDLIEVDFSKKQNGDNLTIFIDKKGGVSLDDCALVHETIDPLLDELNPTNDAPYYLNVSSPGLDRPIKTDADLERNLGEVLEVTCYQKVGTKKHFVGVLLNFNKDSITLEEDGKQYLLDRKNISKLTKYIEF
ncbi:MAG: ribosome maturation factor RimP [Clostridia bacterium]|nr:ribosome maturation factor RimP [Clostridia bacterium]